jgi:hypothetical protein
LNAPAPNTLRRIDEAMRQIGEAAPAALSASARPRDVDNRFSVMSPRRNTLSVIVRTYKAALTSACRATQRSQFAWQRGFYEHVVRNPRQLDALRCYVLDNPLK